MGWKILDSTGAEKKTSASGVSTPTKTILTASSGTYTTPVGCTEIFVECIGQGGGGGGVNCATSGQVAVASGGGGGAYAASRIVNPSASYAYAVGQGANGGAAGANNGTAGADTSFGGGIILAKGGGAGNGAANTAAPQYTSGVAGGVGSSCVGQITIDGGGSYTAWSPAATIGIPGAGGAGAVYGVSHQTAEVTTAGNGANGRGYGGGGQGGYRVASTGTQSGGNGANGVIIITEYYGTPTASNIPVQAPTTTYLTASSGTYTTPANCAYIVVEAIGGGGAGGPCNAGPAAGGGGGGGAYAKKTIQNPSSTYAYAIGQGGTATSYPTAGNAGGDTTFGSTVVVAKGGNGGSPGGSVTPPVPGGGPVAGGSGAASTGDLTVDGGNSIIGFSMSTSWVLGGIGGAGAGPYGGKQSVQRESASAIAGASGELYGGGGSGGTASSGGAAQQGGVGAQGVIVVTEYYQQPQQFIAPSSSPRFSSNDFASGPPANPVNGDIWYATNVDGNGTTWQFRYNANSTSAYKWEFVGGPDSYAHYDYPGGVVLGTSTFVTLTGCQVTVARGGDYLLTGEAQLATTTTSGSVEFIAAFTDHTGALFSAAAGSSYLGFPIHNAAGSGIDVVIPGNYPATGLAAGETILLRGWCNAAGTNTGILGRLFVRPIRVS